MRAIPISKAVRYGTCWRGIAIKFYLLPTRSST